MHVSYLANSTLAHGSMRFVLGTQFDVLLATEIT